MISAFLKTNRSALLFGISMAFLFLLLKWLEARFVVIDHAMEIYIGSIALIFTALGIWLSNRLFSRTKTVVVEKEVIIHPQKEFSRNETEIERIGLSPREMAVLDLMAEGCSNQEIADKLFVSLSTVKTHSSNILSKMDVKRRTQAIDQAKKLGILR